MVYSYSINIHVPGLHDFLESIFCLLLVLEPFSQLKVLEMLENVVVSWPRGQVNMADKANLHSQIRLTSEALVVGCAVGHCHGKELGPFC